MSLDMSLFPIKLKTLSKEGKLQEPFFLRIWLVKIFWQQVTHILTVFVNFITPPSNSKKKFQTGFCDLSLRGVVIKLTSTVNSRKSAETFFVQKYALGNIFNIRNHAGVGGYLLFLRINDDVLMTMLIGGLF